MKISAQEPGLLLSGTTHIALILWGLFALSSPKAFDDLSEAVPVDVISESQFREMTKGRPDEKQVIANAPRRVDRVAKTEEDKDPGVEKKDVPAPPPAPTRPAVKQAEDETDPAPPPPAKLAKAEPPKAPPPPARPPEPAKPEPAKPEPKPQAMKPAQAKASSAEDDEEDEDEAKIIRQKQKKIEAQKAEEARKEEARKEEARRQAEREKQEAVRKAAEAQKIEDDRRKAEERRKEDARKLAEKRQAEREAAEEAAKERAEAEREKAEAIRKAAEAQKIAEARQKALDDQKKKAAEAARRAAEAKIADDARKAAEKAESDKLAASIRNRLLAARETPASSGATGQQVTRTASIGAPAATGAKLSPSDREQLMGIIKEQMERCWSVTTTAVPAVKPVVRLQLTAAGAILSAPALLNSGDSNFQAVADSGMRAIRQCAPYRIPAKFSDKYNDWKTITVKLDPSDLL